MDIYIDTANLDEIKQAAALGVLDGVTTNPSLLAREGTDSRTRLEQRPRHARAEALAHSPGTDQSVTGRLHHRY